MSEPLLTANDLAAWLNISRTTAYTIEAGRVQLRPDGTVRWDRAKVQAWIDGLMGQGGGDDRPPVAYRHVTLPAESPSRRPPSASRRRAGRKT